MSGIEEVAAVEAAPEIIDAISGLEKGVSLKDTLIGGVVGGFTEAVITHAGAVKKDIVDTTEWGYNEVKNGVGEAWNYIKTNSGNTNGLNQPINSSINQSTSQTTIPFNRKNYNNVPSSIYGIGSGINTSPAPITNKQTIFPY